MTEPLVVERIGRMARAHQPSLPPGRTKPTQDLPTPGIRTQERDGTVIPETPPEERPPCKEHDSTPEAILDLANEVIALLGKQATKGPDTTAIKIKALGKLNDMVSHLEEHEVLYDRLQKGTNAETNHDTQTRKDNTSNDTNKKQSQPNSDNMLHILNASAVEIVKATFRQMEKMAAEMAEMRKEMAAEREEMKKEMAEMKNALSKNTITSNPSNHISQQVYEPPSNQPRRTHHRKVITPDKDEELKRNREKLTIKLKIAKVDDTTKRHLKETPGKEITKTIQAAIDREYQHSTSRPRVCGFDVLSDDTIRIQCHDEESTTMLKESMNWGRVAKGIEPRVTKYGIVVHHVDKGDIQPNNNDTYDTQIQTLQEENQRCDLHIVQIIPLRRRPNKTAKHYSIVIFTNNPHEADNCIEKGIIVNGRFHKAERYTPQLNITQCYKC